MPKRKAKDKFALFMLAFFAGALLLVCSSAASRADDEPVIIHKSGSTNSGPYSIEVNEDGSTVFSDGSSRKDGRIATQLAEKLFNDVSAVEPLERLATVHCAKSVSFGTSTSVSFQDATTPDISCGDRGPAGVLYQDTVDIEQSLKIGRVLRRSQ